MSAQANIVAFDGAATPVSHTLQPLGASRSADGVLVADWAERLTAVPFDAQVQVSTRKRKLKSGQEQVSLSVRVPVMEAVSGQNAAGYTAAPEIAFEDTIVITGYFSPRSAESNRKLVQQLAVNIFGGISTTVTPATTGPAAELFQKSISAS
jgi:hypothetical protein